VGKYLLPLSFIKAIILLGIFFLKIEKKFFLDFHFSSNFTKNWAFFTPNLNYVLPKIEYDKLIILLDTHLSKIFVFSSDNSINLLLDLH